MVIVILPISGLIMGLPKGKTKALIDTQKTSRECGVLTKKVGNGLVKLEELKGQLHQVEGHILQKSGELFYHQIKLNDTLKMVFEVNSMLEKYTNELFVKQQELNTTLKKIFEINNNLKNIEVAKIKSTKISRESTKISREIINVNMEVQRKRKRLERRVGKYKSMPPSNAAVKGAVSISCTKLTKRKRNPSSDDLPLQSKVVRCNETFVACAHIHGGSRTFKSPVLSGMMETVTRKFPVREIVKYLTTSKNYLTNNLEKVYLLTWHNLFYISEENKLRSLSIYYSHVMGKRKYQAVRKCNRNSVTQKGKLPNFVSYQNLSGYIGNIDVGVTKPIADLVPSLEEGISGRYRDVAQYVQHLAGVYLRLNATREDKLLEFHSFKKRDTSSFLFAISFGGDGAPGVGTVFSINFLNVGKRISSSKESYVVFGGDVGETDLVVKNFVLHATKSFEYLESKVFIINGINVEFKLAELPNDMKMLSFLAGELTNSAAFFTTFADVKSPDHRKPNYSFSMDGSCEWKPFTYQKRVEDAKKVNLFKKDPKRMNPRNAEKTNRKNLTAYIANTLKSRQEVLPLMKNFIDLAKAEALHIKNNTCKEYFLKLWHVIYTQCDAACMSKVSSYSKLPANHLFVKLVSCVKKEMKLNQLSKKMISWFNETNRGIEKDFLYRFRGEESYGVLSSFAEVIATFLPIIGTEEGIKRLLEVHHQLILLRKMIAYSVRISHFTNEYLEDMKVTARKLFRFSCEWEKSTSVSMWVLCNVAPVHAEETMKAYGFGLGINLMEAREQKHQQIKKYAENSTVQTKWEMIFRHEYLQCIFLKEKGFDEVRYRKKGRCYLPEFSKDCCSDCGLSLVNAVCPLCSHETMADIINSI